MLEHIQRLTAIAHKNERIILGSMSGTSLDGLDLALCCVKGSGKSTKIEVLNKNTIPYSEPFKQEVRKIFSKHEGSIELLTLLHSHIGRKHGYMIISQLKEWQVNAQDIDLIASHGQTIYHAPKSKHQRSEYENGTMQIGDADHIAYITGIITIGDFRLKHIAAGGEGAPLAVYGDYFLFSDPLENRVMLNIGGISNLTWLPNVQYQLRKPCFTTDIGPGNTLIDGFVSRHYKELKFDIDGLIAQRGKVHEALLTRLMQHPFFTLAFPKSTGQEIFNQAFLEESISSINQTITNDDVVSTLTYFTAYSIAKAINDYIGKEDVLSIFVSGGGLHNATMMRYLQSLLPSAVFRDTKEYGIDPDAKEAVLFALLANECVAGSHYDFDRQHAGLLNIGLGKISFPS